MVCVIECERCESLSLLALPLKGDEPEALIVVG